MRIASYAASGILKMAISAEAERNHDALFPNHKSTLKETDPELVAIFDNWAFGEVQTDAPLEPRTRDEVVSQKLNTVQITSP
jgi:hypothetical protein